MVFCFKMLAFCTFNMAHSNCFFYWNYNIIISFVVKRNNERKIINYLRKQNRIKQENEKNKKKID